jgi:hypothetical protein
VTAAYTADLPDAFFAKLRALAFSIKPTVPELAEWMLAVMYSESGINAGASNSIGCVGLLGFCQTTSGYTQDQIHAMGPTQQLDVVGPFVKSYASHIDRRPNVYQGNFLPASFARGTSLGTVLAAQGGTGYGGAEDAFYKANPLLDYTKDGKITVGDLELRLKAIEKDKRYQEALARLRAAPSPALTIAGQLTGVALAGLVAWGALAAYRSPEVRKAMRDSVSDARAMLRRHA